MKNNNQIFLIIGAMIVVIAIVLFAGGKKPEPSPATVTDEFGVETQTEIKTLADGTKYIIDPKKILSGGPPKDGIPSIDNPKFVSVSDANEWLEDDELVLVVEHNGIKRVYPFQIMVWHEIVNDNFGEDPILVTYCPLCGSGIAYERKINGEEVEFGTSGKLFNSNLVMYDRKTDTYWSQIGGKAIVGPLTGQKLTLIDSNTVEWGPYRDVNPDAEVLSRETGFLRSYGRDPYGGYAVDTELFFPVDNLDDSFHPKTVVFGIEIDEVFKAYRETDLKEAGTVEDTVNGVPLKIEIDEAGLLTITRTDTNEEIPKERDFWFAWAAFHPETLKWEP